jgi:hypothetical protein
MAIVEDVPESEAYSYSSAVCSFSHANQYLRNRLTILQTADIPLRHPSEIHSRHSAKEPLIKPDSLPPTSGSGSGSKAPIIGSGVVEEEIDPDGDFTEEVFDTVMLTVPFTFLFILLHVYVVSIYAYFRFSV